MRHDWIIDVLSDLRTYAEQNGLPATARAADAALAVARDEARQTAPLPLGRDGAGDDLRG